MRHSMNESINNYEPSSNFVKINVAIQRQYYCQPHFPKLCYAVSKHDYQNKHAGKIQALPAGPGPDYPPVARVVVILEIPKGVKSGNKQTQIDQNKQDGK